MDVILIFLIYGCLAYLLGCLIFPPVLRWPLALVLYIISVVELILYLCLRYLIYFLELFRNTGRRYAALRKRVRTGYGCNSYEEWEKDAKELDMLDGRERWKDTLESSVYNYELVQMLLNTLRSNITALNEADAALASHVKSGLIPEDIVKRSNEATAVLYRTLQTCLKRNVGGILNESLYSQTNTGTKRLVSDFVAEVQNGLYCLGRVDHISNAVPEPLPANATPDKAECSAERNPGEVPLPSPTARCDALRTELAIAKARLTMLADLRRAFGHTALSLSGGGGLGLYHLGHVRALIKLKLLPKIISGASAGALVAAHVCCRTDEELEQTLNPEALLTKMRWDNGLSWFAKFKKYLKDGYMFDTNQWVTDMRWHTCGDMTFLEAYRKTGRSLVISATSSHHHEPPVFMSHITTPHVLIWSAIIASASVPGLLPLARLYEKDENGEVKPCEAPHVGLRDGSFKSDIPTSEMAFYFNAGFFIVAQVNPHIVPFFFYSQGDAGRGIGRWAGWRGGYVLSFLESLLKNELRKNVSIMRDMGLLPTVMGADWSFLFLQNFEGHITLVPQIDFKAYMNIINAPSIPDLERYFKVGELTIYRKLTLMRTRLLICNTLTEVTERLSARRRQTSQKLKATFATMTEAAAAQKGMRVIRSHLLLGLDASGFGAQISPRPALMRLDSASDPQALTGLRADDMDFVVPTGVISSHDARKPIPATAKVASAPVRPPPPPRMVAPEQGQEDEETDEEGEAMSPSVVVTSEASEASPSPSHAEPKPNLGVPKRDQSAAEAALRALLALIFEDDETTSPASSKQQQDQARPPESSQSVSAEVEEKQEDHVDDTANLLSNSVAVAESAIGSARANLAKLLMLPKSMRTALATVLQANEYDNAPHHALDDHDDEGLGSELTRGFRRGTDAVASQFHRFVDRIRTMPQDVRSHVAELSNGMFQTQPGSPPLLQAERMRLAFLRALRSAGFADDETPEGKSSEVSSVDQSSGIPVSVTSAEQTSGASLHSELPMTPAQAALSRSSLRNRRHGVSEDQDEVPAAVLTRDGSRPRRETTVRRLADSTEYVPY